MSANNPDFKKARGYMVWNIPVDSQCRIQFLAEDYGILAIDGKMIAKLEPELPEGKGTEQWISFTIGEMLHQELRRKNPDFVFIGNSMLWSWIEDAHLPIFFHGLLYFRDKKSRGDSRMNLQKVCCASARCWLLFCSWEC
jgi:hypothetical protein